MWFFTIICVITLVLVAMIIKRRIVGYGYLACELTNEFGSVRWKVEQIKGERL